MTGDIKPLTKEDREHFLGKFLPFAVVSDEDIVRSGYQHFFRRYEATVHTLEQERDRLRTALRMLDKCTCICTYVSAARELGVDLTDRKYGG